MTVFRALFFKYLAAGAVAAGTLLCAASANATDLNWSVGINAPGIAFGVEAPPPVYFHPAPVYYQAPPPVYYRPAPVYGPPPEPAYYAPPGYGWGRDHHHRRDRDDHNDRDD